MKLIKEVIIKALQILVVVIMTYIMLESFDGSMKFHEERMATHQAQYKQVLVERRF